MPQQGALQTASTAKLALKLHPRLLQRWDRARCAWRWPFSGRHCFLSRTRTQSPNYLPRCEKTTGHFKKAKAQDPAPT